MLTLLRKYQKIFFIGITAVLTFSFMFFGMSGTEDKVSAPQDEKVATLIDGSKLMKSQLLKMVHFLSYDHKNFYSSHAQMPNLFNNEVVRKDFIETGISQKILSNYSDDFKDELNERLLKIKGYNFYEHPKASFISSRAVYKQFYPQLLNKVDRLKQYVTLNENAIGDLISLFLFQEQIPKNFVQRVLHYQQNQYAEIEPDPYFASYDFALFGFHNIEDWFGKNYLQAVAQFIFNTAAKAKKAGYQVSKEEIELDLVKNLKEGISLYKQKVSSEEMNEIFNTQLQSLGFYKKDLFEVWEQIALFRKYYRDVENSVYFDPDLLGGFSSFAHKKIIGTIYEPKEHMRFSSFNDMMKFQIYLKAVSPQGQGAFAQLNLPESHLPVHKIETSYPELVYKTYDINYKTVDLNTVETFITEKELFNWQLDIGNWNLLKAEFPQLSSLDAASREDRFAILEGLEEGFRLNVDSFSKKKMLTSNYEYHLKAFDDIQYRTASLTIPYGKGKTPFDLEDNESLIKLLDEAPMQGETLNASQKNVHKELQCYSQNNRNFYSIEVVKKSKDKKVMSYEEAVHYAVLDEILETELRKHYEFLKNMSSSLIQDGDTEFLPYVKARDQVARSLFQNLLNEIDSYYVSEKGEISWKEGQGPLDFYAKNRLLFFAKKMRDTLSKDEKFISKWAFVSRDAEISSQDLDPSVSQDLLSINHNEYSNVYSTNMSNVCFMQLKKVSLDESMAKQFALKAQTSLKEKAGKDLTEKLMNEIGLCNAIQFVSSGDSL